MTEHDTTDTKPDAPPEFLAFLATHARGRTADQLSAGLAELVVAVRETGKKGSLQLTVTITPDGKVPDAVRVEDKIVRKVPELERPASMFFATPDGQLSTSHPDQLSFDVGRDR